MRKSKELVVVHYTDVYAVREGRRGKVIAIRNTQTQAKEVADNLNERRKWEAGDTAYLPNKRNKRAWTRKEVFFICFCQEFDKTSGRHYPKRNWYQYDNIQPTEEWKAEMPKFYKWFCKANLRDLPTYELIVKNYFSTKRKRRIRKRNLKHGIKSTN